MPLLFCFHVFKHWTSNNSLSILSSSLNSTIQIFNKFTLVAQPACTCLEVAMEKPEQFVDYIQI